MFFAPSSKGMDDKRADKAAGAGEKKTVQLTYRCCSFKILHNVFYGMWAMASVSINRICDARFYVHVKYRAAC